MSTDINSALSNFLKKDEKEANNTVSDKKKTVKSDRSIIERVDKIIIAENGKQLLREQY